mgnify:CR=1 FL=1
MLNETAAKIRELHAAGLPVPAHDLLDAGVLVPSREGLLAARLAAGLTQDQVQQRLGVKGGDGTVVSRWENGVYRPKTTTVCTLASMYGCEVRDLCESAPGPSSGS